MSNIAHAIKYRCSDDCEMSGCPGHDAEVHYNSTSDSYMFRLNDRDIHFQRGELDAMLDLLMMLDRVDSVGTRINSKT